MRGVYSQPVKRAVEFNRGDILTQMQAGLGAFALPSGIESTQLAAALTAYLAELHKWNRAYNLTAVRDPREMLTRHIYDSLTALPFVHGRRIGDVGTGAGLPGIPLALCFPHAEFTLVDTNGKKTRFVQHAAAHLQLANIDVVQTRVEQFAPERLFDTVFCRAFTSLAEFVAGSGHLVEPDGRLIAMKGKYPDEEIAALQGGGWAVSDSTQVTAPGLKGERHILTLQRV